MKRARVGFCDGGGDDGDHDEDDSGDGGEDGEDDGGDGEDDVMVVL